MERKFECPLCGAALDFPVENPACGGFQEWHLEDGFAFVNIQVSYEEEEEKERS